MSFSWACKINHKSSHVNGPWWWFSLVVVGSLSAASLALAKEDLPSIPERVVQVRGQDSIIEELNMGPEATALWRKIQEFVADGADLTDFSRVINLLNLRVKDPIEEIDINTSKPQLRRDIRGGGLISGGNYGVAFPVDGSGRRTLHFRVDLDVTKICISKSEVERVYGKETPSIPAHMSYAYVIDPTGISHGVGYKFSGESYATFGFDFPPSGCATSFSVARDLPKLSNNR